MKREEKASISIIKIICVSIILILISGIGVMAVNTNLKDIKIILQNGYEMTALTSKTTVSEVLEENNIVLKEDQKTIPDLDSQISAGQNIQITDKSYNEVKIAKISEEGAETTLEQLLQNYAPITEKIVVEQVAIPYETITKNSTSADSNTTNKVLKEGKDGIKEVTYKIKYQNEVEIEKTVISEVVVQEPVNKIVQVQKKVETSRSADLPRTSGTTTTAVIDGETYKITAYCSCRHHRRDCSIYPCVEKDREWGTYIGKIYSKGTAGRPAQHQDGILAHDANTVHTDGLRCPAGGCTRACDRDDGECRG